MGKGDKKTKKGKISAGSYGVTRKRKNTAVDPVIQKTKKKIAPKTEVKEKAAPAKKTTAKAKKEEASK